MSLSSDFNFLCIFRRKVKKLFPWTGGKKELLPMKSLQGIT